MKIIDNFLPDQEFLDLQNTLMGSNMTWFYCPSILQNDKGQENLEKFQFTHMFYVSGKKVSPFFPIIENLLKKINYQEMFRIKVNLGTLMQKQIMTGFHSDTPFPCKTAIFYINSNNGYTLFENGEKIDSVANRFIEFDSELKHCGVTQTDTQVRCLINLNYSLA